VAGPDGESVLSRARLEQRHTQVARVLVRVLFLNLAVAAAKIAFGYASGASASLSDGFHSLTDAATNVIGLVGIRAAGQPPDEDHPYGHRKYETVAASAIAAFLLLLILEVLRNAYARLTGPADPGALAISLTGFVVMLATIGVNVVVVLSRARRPARQRDPLADALQTRGDIWTSATVLWRCRPALGPADSGPDRCAFVVAGFIGHAGFQIAQSTTHPERPHRDARSRNRAGCPACPASSIITSGAGALITCLSTCTCGCRPT
jgi:divalent metal cation (Fe/Co/Zn/Cd) transporter